MLHLLLLSLITLTAAGAAPPVPKTAVINSTKGGKAQVAGTQDLIIIIREPSATTPAAPIVEYHAPPGSSKPKELILDSLEDAERLAKMVKQKQPKASSPDADSPHEQQQDDSKKDADSPDNRLEDPEQKTSNEDQADQVPTRDSDRSDSTDSTDTTDSTDSGSTYHSDTEGHEGLVFAPELKGGSDSSSGDHYPNGGSRRQGNDDSSSSSSRGGSRDKEGGDHASDDSSKYEQKGSREDESYRSKEEAENDHSSSSGSGSGSSGSSHEHEEAPGSEKQQQEDDADSETWRHHAADDSHDTSSDSRSSGSSSRRELDSGSGRDAADSGRRDSSSSQGDDSSRSGGSSSRGEYNRSRSSDGSNRGEYDRSSSDGSSRSEHDSGSSKDTADAGRRDSSSSSHWHDSSSSRGTSRDSTESHEDTRRQYSDTDKHTKSPADPDSDHSDSHHLEEDSSSKGEHYQRRSQQGSHAEEEVRYGNHDRQHSTEDRDQHHEQRQPQQQQRQQQKREDATHHIQHKQSRYLDNLSEEAERDYMAGLPGSDWQNPPDDGSWVDPLAPYYPETPGTSEDYSSYDSSYGKSKEDSSYDSTSGKSKDYSSFGGYQGPDRYRSGGSSSGSSSGYGGYGGGSSKGGPSPYPKMEEPAGYYEQPHLHTTCLQVIRAHGIATGPVTYDLRCCQRDRDDPRVCMKPVEPYSPSGYSDKLKLRDVIQSSLKVGSCVFTPSINPCPYSSGPGACQAYDGSCVLSRVAADCGCPISTGLILNVTAYARSEAALSCNPVFSITYTAPRLVGRRLLQANYTDIFAPYMGVATVISGFGESPDGVISAGITMVTGFGVPAPGPAIGRRLLASGLPPFRKAAVLPPILKATASPPAHKATVAPVARKATVPLTAGNNVKAARLSNYGMRGSIGPRTRLLPTVFDSAPSAPLPLPDLPFVLGGRMIIEWSR